MDSLYKNKHDFGLGKKPRKFSFNFKKHKKLYIIILAVLLISGISTYLIIANNYIPSLEMVSGTEYISGEEGQVIVRLENDQGKPLENANCLLTLLYPDKSYFLIDVPMKQTTIPGNYYHSFTTPSPAGVYEEYISCELNKGDSMYNLQISNSFHVSTGLNLVVEMSKKQEFQYKELIKKLNELDSNITTQINDINSRVYSLQTTIDSNVMTEMHYLSTDLKDVNSSFNSSIDEIEDRLDDRIEHNFKDLYDKFRDSYDSMAGFFIND